MKSPRPSVRSKPTTASPNSNASKRAVRLRTWIDKTTGMVRLSGELDPDTGLALLGRLNNRVETLFHDRTPAHVPQRPTRQTGLPPRPRPARPHHQRRRAAGRGGPRCRSSSTCTTLIARTPRQLTRRLRRRRHRPPVDTIRHMTHVRRHHRDPARRPRRRAADGPHQTTRHRRTTPGDPSHVPHAARSPAARPTSADANHTTASTGTTAASPTSKSSSPSASTTTTSSTSMGWVLTLGADRSLTITTPDGTTMTTGPPSDQWT